MGEPGPGSIAVGYVRYSSEMQDPASIVTQKRVISEFADKKGWRIVRWYVEPEQSAKYEDVDERPVFAQMLKDGESGAFQVALCYANNRWSRNTALTFLSLSRLRRARVLTKDTVAAIRRLHFPREFAPGCGHGTIVTPSGDLVEGKHPAAWPYELWNRMDEVKMSQFRRPTKDAKRRPHEFSRIIVCAACRRPLRVMLPKGIPY